MFIDIEIVVQLPDAWTSEEMRQEIDDKVGAQGFFNAHGQFNPSNHTRMKLPWDEPQLKVVLGNGRSDYDTG